MKYFEHGDEAPSLLARRAKQSVPDKPGKAWSSFKRGGKSAAQLIERLLPLQYYLCSYCENLLSDSPEGLGFHIEHILSKSLNPELTFEYTNLMLSCFKSGGEVEVTPEDPQPTSCGHARLKTGNQYDELQFIKPTDADCECYFYYELQGDIAPHPNLSVADAARAQHTIDVLNLNCLRLKRLRADIVKQSLIIVNSLIDQPKSLQYFINLELEVRRERLASFWTTRKQILESLSV